MMCTSGRITHILDEVQALWIKYPDLRFLQLVEIMMDRAEHATGKDSFMIEDDELLEIGLQSLWNEVTV